VSLRSSLQLNQHDRPITVHVALTLAAIDRHDAKEQEETERK
jgi:hypothetical protein